MRLKKKVLFSILSFSLFALSAAFLPAIAQSGTLQGNIKQDTVKQENTQRQAYEKRGKFEQAIRNSADLEIDGLIVDETITKIGRDFYQIFQRQWEPPAMAKNFTILIKELPARGNGALIQVAVNDQDIMEQQVQPKYDFIEEVAIYATGVVYEFLVRDQLQQQLEAEGKKARELF
ncbi:CsgE family curli-type amyloid fiber assembly protein [Pontibacter oryzae]|uniref:CsgE family curli-type amyloid fiber assembly protein n=1 Tax=Pontibacter oryzae TaxID=2304593 RepID=UPI0013153B96|nr:CsgE family curli-type amyloid fiber assembly protein [Pontibacter oryzae]